MLPWRDAALVAQFAGMKRILRGPIPITEWAVEKVQECILEELRGDRLGINETRAVFRPSGIDVVRKPCALQFLEANCIVIVETARTITARGEPKVFREAIGATIK